MALEQVHIAGYRSIRTIHLPVRRLSVLVGGNGVGKTNLYRALELAKAAALGTLADEIAREGGLGSVLWAGERRSHEKPLLVLEVALAELVPGPGGKEFAPRYRVEVGFPAREAVAAFPLEAQIKRETVSLGPAGRNTVLMERQGSTVWARDANGRRTEAATGLLSSETALATLPGGYPEVDAVREALAAWRFYHGFRSDAGSPLRQPALAVTSPTLTEDGANLAAVFATLVHIRQDTADLDGAIAAAFPGARLIVDMPGERASLAMQFPEMPKRPFGAHELSDGTLHFLALMGALLSYRIPPLIALNEPETSLHPALLPALAGIIARAAERTQIWVVTHSRALADALETETGAVPRQVVRLDGGTWLEGLSQLGTFADD